MQTALIRRVYNPNRMLMYLCDFCNIQNPQQAYANMYYTPPTQMPVQAVNMQTSNIPYAIPIYSNQMMPDQPIPGYYNQYVSPVSPGSTPKDEKSPQHGKSQSKVKENVKEVGSKVVSAYGALWVFIYVFLYLLRKGLERGFEKQPQP